MSVILRGAVQIAARLAERKASDVAEAALVALRSLLKEQRARQDSKGARGRMVSQLREFLSRGWIIGPWNAPGSSYSLDSHITPTLL